MRASKSGYALVDALTALTLLGITLGVAISSASAAQRLAARALYAVDMNSRMALLAENPTAALGFLKKDDAILFGVEESRVLQPDRLLETCERRIRIGAPGVNVQAVRVLRFCPPPEK